METKRCTRCGEEKPVAEFYAKSGHPGKYRPRCKSCVGVVTKAYTGRPEIKAKVAEYQREWHRRHPGLSGQRSRQYRELYPEMQRAGTANYRAKAIGAPGRLSRELFNALWVAQAGQCFYCSVPLATGYHTDHRTPLIRGGSNEPENICLACPACNDSKGKRTEHEFRNGLPRGDRPPTKVCTGCGEEKPSTEEFFYKRSDQLGTFKSRCKRCEYAITSAYAKAHPEMMKKARERLFKKDPERVRDYWRKHRLRKKGAAEGW